LQQFSLDQHDDLVAGITLNIASSTVLHTVFQHQEQIEAKTSLYGGPVENAALWAHHVSLDFIRRNLIRFTGEIRTGVT
jgi:hypothetical protein